MLTNRPHGFFLLVLLMCLAVAVSACKSKGPRYPEDHARFQRIDAAMKTLRTAYTQQNLRELRSLLLPSDRLDRMKRDAEKDFKTFQEIELNFFIDRIMIEGESIDVFLHWQGQWKLDAKNPGIRQRGHGILRWIGVKSILLRGIEGDLPFGMSNRIVMSDPQDAPLR